MSKDQILGKLRFDTSLLDQQVQDAVTKLNLIRNLAAQAQKAAAQVKMPQPNSGSSGGSRGGGGGGKGSAANNTAQKALAQQLEYYNHLKTAVADLTKAQREYIAAINSGNNTLKQRWDAEKQYAKQDIDRFKQQLNGTDSTTRVYERYQKLLRDIESQKLKFDDTLARTQNDKVLKGDMQYANQIKELGNQLKQAYAAYNDALKSNDGEEVSKQEAEIAAINDKIAAVRELAGAYVLLPEAQEAFDKESRKVDAIQTKGVHTTQQTVDGLHKQKQETKQVTDETSKMVSQLERWAATMIVMRGLRNLWRNMTDYAAEYYDALNEIRIVTMKTEEEAAAQGDSYRKLAADMSVSSTEVAKAAVEYWRQGLDEDTVNERLQATIAYAKISSMEFTEAAELMTAATNSMGLDATHVADVWAYLGDASASGADEVGTAMQKVSASARTAGIEFEWLGAYIATLTEKTRQAPEAIGTALNAILSRLQQIKAKGFNSEDIYGINDIAKALGSLEKPIALMDEVTGEWRDIPVIFQEIADQWQNLTDKEQAYIATTMGGTRQRNYLLTLLEDLSLGAENGSRAWELYEGALNSAGLAMEKYAIYEESAEAAQGRFKASLEELYSILNGATIIGFYDMLTSVVTWINQAADATDGWTIYLGIAAAGITLLVLALRNVVLSFKASAAAAAANAAGMAATGAAATAAAGGISMMNIALAATVAGAVIIGIGTIIGSFVQLGKEASKAAEHTKELSESLSGSRSESGDIRETINKVKEQSKAFSGSEEDVKKFNAIRGELISEYPGLKSILKDEVKTVEEQGDTYRDTTAYLEKFNAAKIRENWRNAKEGVSEAESAYSSARDRYTGQMHQLGDIGTALTGLKSGVEQGRYHTSDPAEFLENMDSWNLNAYSTAIEAFRMNIALLQKKLENADGDLADIYLSAINAWTDTLYEVLEPGMDKMTSDADEIMGNALEVIIDHALNPYKFTKIGNDLPMLADSMLSMAWKNEYGLPMTVEEIRTRVDEMVDDYVAAIYSAEGKIQNLIAAHDSGNLGEDADWMIRDIFGILRDGYVPEDKIVEIMEPVYEAIGRTRDQLLADLFGEGETAEVNTGNDKTFEEKLEDAFSLLERLETLREAIKDIIAEGGLTKDVVDSLTKAFGPEFMESLIESATDEVENNLDISAQLEALKERITEEEELDPDSSAFLAMLGLNEDSEAAVKSAMDRIAEAADIEDLKEIWSELPDSVKDALGDTGREIEALLAEAADDAEDSADRIQKAMQKIRRSAELDDLTGTNQVWSDLKDIVEDLAGTADQASGAIGNITGHLHDAAEAAGALEAAAAGDEDALEYLANLTGLTADILANDLTPAELQVALMGDQASASMEYLANMLYLAGSIEIDASGKVVAIGSIEQAAANAGMTVANLAAMLASLNGASLTYQATANGIRVVSRVPAIKWTGGSSSKKSSGGGGSGKKGGGGGGGGGSNSVSEIVEALVDAFDRVNTLRDHRRELAQLGQAYHEARGEIQGVIGYLDAERTIVEEDTAALETYLRQLEEQIEANRAVVQTQAAGSKAYNQAMIDLEKLQEEHQKYSQQLIKNKTDVEQLTQAIKEQYNKIRQMEIDLRDTILEAVEDREAAEERKLGGRIEMEETIMDLIKKRYEAERDQIVETQNARRDALEEELDQIDELLAARKKLAEQEDKMAEIAELEAQIARISADPTRQKEALQLREKLAKLREDMAWDTAEAEAEAQKDSVKKQITSIEDYIKYVEEYYEELFRNPQELIEEMQEILTWTDEQIIEWLKKNEESYATSTESVQRKMVNEWQDTLDDMRDTIRTHWEEIEEIIAGGADNIINFLTTYSQKYREAGKLQAEAYVDEWRKQLTDLENAYKQVQVNISSYDYVATTKVSSSGGSGGGSGGGGGSGVSGAVAGAASALNAVKAGAGAGAANLVSNLSTGTYRYGYKKANGSWTAATASTSQQTAFANAKQAALAYWSNQPDSAEKWRVMADINSAIIGSLGNYLAKFKRGGLNTRTGLAWLDGTPTQPERILSAHQTELFEDMINTLHAIRGISMNANFMAPKMSDRSQLPNIDSIVVNVANLDSSTDYEDAAEKMMNAFYEKVSRGRAVGGIQNW